MSIVGRWRARLSTRRGLLKRAEASVRYWARRAGSARGRQMLAEAVARRALRRKQVAEAERVLARQDPNRHISRRGLALIAGFEGFRSAPYRDAVGVWTIGYGSTKGVGPNTPHVTRAQALERMRQEIADTYEPPVRALWIPLTQGQFDALVSAVYNLGGGVLDSGRSLGDALRRRDYRGAADALLLYDKAGGRTLPGLTRRRRAERALFLS